MRGLIIDEPWIGLILAGTKTWEMRKGATHIRGPIALIRKGNGAVVGVAELTGSLPDLDTADAYARAEPFHAIPPARQVRAREDGWRTPWVLANARPLAKPVPYEHPNGAVIWVNLSPAVADAIKAQGVAVPTPAESATTTAPPRRTAAAASRIEKVSLAATTAKMARAGGGKRTRVKGRIEGDVCYVPITGGNIEHGHVYLRSVLPFFPDDCVGGSDKSQRATRLVTLAFKGGPTVQTDIAGPDRAGGEGKSSHLFFREARTGVLRSFFERFGAEPGDEVVFRRTSAYGYDVELQKRAV